MHGATDSYRELPIATDSPTVLLLSIVATSSENVVRDSACIVSTQILLLNLCFFSVFFFLYINSSFLLGLSR